MAAGALRRIAALGCALALACFGGQAAAQSRPVVVGVVLPQTGMLADLGAGMRDALLLWQERVNAAGGLTGRKVELRIHDDASEAVRSTRLYELLVREDRAEILIGPFGSAATSMAAAVADRARRVMVNATGTSPAIHKRAFRYVFQVPPPSDAYAAGLLPLAQRAGARTLTVAASNPAGATALGDLLKSDALKRGVVLQPAAIYEGGGVVDLAPFAAALKAAGVEALASPADVRETANLLRGLRAAGYTPRLFAAQGVGDPAFIAQAGIDAEFALGFSNYEPNARSSGNAEFVRAYRARYKRAPDFHAACGWAAAQIVEAAVARAGSFEQAALRVALATLESASVLGAYKVDVDGAQIGAQPLMVQIQKGRREVVWPEAAASAAAALPAQPWGERALQPKK